MIFENKSGVASKKSLLVGASVIDHGYSGEVHINLINAGNKEVTISPGDKIIQGIMYEIGTHTPVETPIENMWIESNSERKENGFGSTGIK
jgi:dUTPase